MMHPMITCTSSLLVLLTVGASKSLPTPPVPPRFATENAARAFCGSADAVVWADVQHKIWYRAGSRYYGRTPDGVYMCRSTAARADYRQAG
jgi:hypothetical protein